MNPDQVQQIINAIKNASPALLAAARHEVQAQIQVDLMWMILFGIIGLLATLFILWMAWAALTTDDEKDADGAGAMAIIGFVVFVICAVIFFANLQDYIHLTTAGDYATIKALTGLIP